MYCDTIPAKTLSQYVNKPGCLIIDIRDPAEYRQGHVPSAVNIPLDQLDRQVPQLKNYRELVLYCSRGSHSLMCARRLKTNSCCYSVYGGIRAYRGQLVKE